MSAETAWYQEGIWPLIGTIAIVLISNSITIWQVFARSRQDRRNQIYLAEINFAKEQLAYFYDPMLSLLKVNSEIFRKFGPHTFPEDPISATAAETIWKEMRDDVVLPNNTKMIDILRNNSYLLMESDSLDNYRSLQLHLSMYSVFQKYPSEIYYEYRFPEGIENHVRQKRDRLLAFLHSMQERREGDGV